MGPERQHLPVGWLTLTYRWHARGRQTKRGIDAVAQPGAIISDGDGSLGPFAWGLGPSVGDLSVAHIKASNEDT